MKGYKAFKKGLICKDKQYAENTVYEEDEAAICEKGMHFCKNPLDVMDFYPLVDNNGDMTEFAEVEALDEAKTNDNKKYCTKKLKVGAKLSLAGFIAASVDFLFDRTKDAKVDNGHYAKLASSGYGAKLASSGEYSVVCAVGLNSIAKASVGSWITLAEYDENYIVKKVVTKQVDGDKIKADTFYQLKNGKFKEVTE